MYQIPRLDAVNRLLQSADGSVVADLDSPSSDNVTQAQRALEIATDKIQMENEWNFNLDGPRTLTSNGEGEVVLPTQYLYVKFLSWSGGSIWNLTVRDNKLWDLRQGTSQVAGTVEIVGSQRLDYDECPGVIQNLIIEKAKMDWVGLDSHLSASRAQIYARQYQDAYLAAQKWDSQQRWGAMDLTPPMRDVFRRQGTRGGWWWGT